MLFVNPDYLNRKDAKVLKAQIEQQTKERRMLEAEYENRLKADMVDMLKELKAEIEEESWTRECLDGSDETIVDMKSVNEVFQQKINSLKGDTDGNS